MRVGLMGFGRVGRNLFRLLYDMEDVEVAAVSDIADPEVLEYLLRFDSLHGRFPDEVSIRDGFIYVAGKQIPLLPGGEAGEVDWGPEGVDIVVEATAKSWSHEQLSKHLGKGAERVILCSPPLDHADVTIVMGVNDDVLTREHRIISNGSVTAHCAAPILEILDNAFGIERVFLCSVHAYTNKQRLADVPAEDPRSGRAAAENIIPQETNAGRVITKVLPQLEGKIQAAAMNVPVSNGSVVDMVCWHRKPVSVTAINEVVRTAAAAHWEGIVDYEDEPIVSTDIEKSYFSSTFDAQATMTLGEHMSKTLSWFDNHWGYCNRVVDLIDRLRELEGEVA